MAHVAHVWSVYWSNPYTQPPDGFARVVCQARVLVERGRGAGVCPDQIEDAMRFWNRAASGGQREYGAGYSVCWHIEAAPDAPPRRLSEETKQRIRRKRLEKRMRARYPMFADEFIREEIERRPAYFGAQEEEEVDGMIVEVYQRRSGRWHYQVSGEQEAHATDCDLPNDAIDAAIAYVRTRYCDWTGRL